MLVGAGRRLADAEHKLTDMSTKLQQVRWDNQQLTHTKQELSQQLAQKAQELAHSQEQLHELQTQHEVTSTRCASLKGQLKLAQQEGSAQSSSLEALQQQANDLRAAAAVLQGQLAQLTDQHTDLQSIHTQGEDRCGALQAQLASQLEVSEGLKAQLEACNNALTSQQVQYAGKMPGFVHAPMSCPCTHVPADGLLSQCT